MPRPTHQKKLRADSKLNALTAEQRDEFDRMLLACSCTLDEAAAWLAERGVRLSIQSISKYFHARVLPARYRYQNEAAEVLLREDGGRVASAAHLAVRQLFFDRITGPCQMDMDTVKELYKLMLAGLACEQNERKLALSERKAAAADAVRAQLESKKAAGGLSAEALALAEEALGLL